MAGGARGAGRFCRRMCEDLGSNCRVFVRSMTLPPHTYTYTARFFSRASAASRAEGFGGSLVTHGLVGGDGATHCSGGRRWHRRSSPPRSRRRNPDASREGSRGDGISTGGGDGSEVARRRRQGVGKFPFFSFVKRDCKNINKWLSPLPCRRGRARRRRCPRGRPPGT
jgi:hypothetical protein